MKIVLSPGEYIRVVLSDTDGYFEIDYGATALTVFADIDDTTGRRGIIYSEEFGAGMADGTKVAPDEFEAPLSFHTDQQAGSNPDLTKPWCYVIPLEQNITLHGGYVPSLVVEDDPNHYPMMGKTEDQLPWTWGKDLNVALETCRKVNRRMKVDATEMDRIISSSMSAALRDATVQDVPEKDMLHKMRMGEGI